MPLVVDGRFGQTTADAVASFQKANKLTADSICGPATWAALEAARDKEDDMNADQERKLDHVIVRINETANAILEIEAQQKARDEQIVALLEALPKAPAR